MKKNENEAAADAYEQIKERFQKKLKKMHEKCKVSVLEMKEIKEIKELFSLLLKSATENDCLDLV